MRFKEFLQLELDGMFGSPKSGGDLGIVQKLLKDCKPVKNKGSTIGRLKTSIITAPTPARPSGVVSYKKPMTIPSVI